MIKHLQEKRPGDYVESFCEIHLEQYHRTPLSIEPTTCEQHGAEVHVYHAPLDEGRLVIVHNVRHSRCQAQGDALSEQLSNGVDQADRPIVPKSSGCLSFVQ